MRAVTQKDRAFLFILVLLATFHLWGLSKVPFHPDESSHIFMSREFKVWLTNPMSMIWNDSDLDIIDRYNRDIDAPLNKYILGLGLSLANIQPLPVDWDWSLTWDKNEQAGALPGQSQLITARLTVTLLLITSVLWIYFSGKMLNGLWNGLIAATLLGTNALILLHDRRAMAESALTLGVCLAILGIFSGDKKPWLAGLGVALAYNAKQSAMPLIAVGLVSVCWLPKSQLRTRRLWANIAVFLGVFMALTLLLNPILWGDPVGVIIKSLRNRQEFLNRQIDASLAFVPEQVMDSPIQRSAVMISNLYIQPPSFYEFGNYTEHTSATEEVYLSIPGHNLLRGVIGGGIGLVLTIFGIAIACFKMIKPSTGKRRQLILLFIGTLFQGASLIIAVPLPYQRYVIPMVPFTCLWIGYGLSQIIGNKSTQP